MCGILGTLPNTEQTFFRSALDTLSHRGPDGFGIWQNEYITLGHRRLSILDLSDAGKQPMEYNHLVITFNGEIYNFIEIKSELQAKGYHFVSESDTEVVLAAYQEWGEQCLRRFNGMWAMAIWNNQTKKLFLARDRFGVKPLFYAFVKGKFIFASEMKAILSFLPEIKLATHFDWCKNNIYEYEATSKCLVEGISRFPAGHFGVVNLESQQIKLTQYWDTLQELEEVPEDYQQQVEIFRERFFEACRIRMRADVKIGTALSGGLDSSSVTSALMYLADKSSRTSPDWQNAFVATFPNTDLDERVYAEVLTSQLGINAIFKEIDPSKGIQQLEDYVWLFEELYLTSPIPMIEIYKTIKQNGVTVSLDGHGADELLSGYGNGLFNIIKDQPFSLSIIGQVIRTYKEIRNIQDKKTWKYFVDGFEGRKNILIHYSKNIFGFNPKENLQTQKLGFFNQYLYTLFHRTILPTLLRNYDRYSMAASVETRMPFMDYRLVKFCFSLPWQSKFNKGYTKAILRDAMHPYMPQEITWRKLKTGFGTPFTEWIRGSWKSYFLDTIHNQDFRESAVIDAKTVKNTIENLISAENPNFAQGQQAWEAIMPYFWEKSFLNRSS